MYVDIARAGLSRYAVLHRCVGPLNTSILAASPGTHFRAPVEQRGATAAGSKSQGKKVSSDALQG